jgi:hypothetical protein
MDRIGLSTSLLSKSRVKVPAGPHGVFPLHRPRRLRWADSSSRAAGRGLPFQDLQVEDKNGIEDGTNTLVITVASMSPPICV